MSGRKRRGEGGGSPGRLDTAGIGAEHQLIGVYRVVEPPKRLVYTWRWKNEPDAPETLVLAKEN